MEIPLSHPRYQSLLLRHKLVNGFKAGLATDSGLLAHGRGEAFYYLLGEKTWDFAKEAIAVASALLLQAKCPVFSVNGNTASIAGVETVELAKIFPQLMLEVNLFHHSPERSQRIAEHLRKLGATRVVESWVSPTVILPGIESNRRAMNAQGIAKADVVLVALEDGDRCEALVKAGYQVISIDLNPMARSAQAAYVTIVDELTRIIPALTTQLQHDKKASSDELSNRISNYDNKKILDRAISAIRNGGLALS
jgi:4-phosphopantoate---beta-alanine ligase